MALKKCSECGHEISSVAKVCPQCGKRQIVIGDLIIQLASGLLLVLLIVSVWKGGCESTSPVPIQYPIRSIIQGWSLI